MSEDDALPEADRAEGAPHPRHTLRLFGQEEAEAEALAAFTTGRPHHAWLLTGPKGVGKATLAWRMARFLLAEAPADAGLFGDSPAPTSLDVPDENPVARRLAALSEPGCLLIRRAWDPDRKRLKAQITVDEVRRLNGFFGLSSAGGGRRVVIVDSADEMNPSAANALLKVLEEPPARAILILISHQPARLLPTIRSRCRTLRLKPLAPEALASALEQAGTEAPDQTMLAELAGGSAGEALRLAAFDGPEIYGRIVGLMGQAPEMDRQAARALVDGVAARGAEERLAMAVRLLNLALARLARIGAGMAPTESAAQGEMDAWAKLALAAPPSRWADLQQEISARLGHGLAVNVDPASLLLDALLRVNEAASGGA